VERARMILLAGKGKRVDAIAEELELSAATVRTWLKRFNSDGLDGLNDLARSGRPTTYNLGWPHFSGHECVLAFTSLRLLQCCKMPLAGLDSKGS
jgi:hypothetical protein